MLHLKSNLSASRRMQKIVGKVYQDMIIPVDALKR